MGFSHVGADRLDTMLSCGYTRRTFDLSDLATQDQGWFPVAFHREGADTEVGSMIHNISLNWERSYARRHRWSSGTADSPSS